MKLTTMAKINGLLFITLSFQSWVCLIVLNMRPINLTIKTKSKQATNIMNSHFDFKKMIFFSITVKAFDKTNQKGRNIKSQRIIILVPDNFVLWIVVGFARGEKSGKSRRPCQVIGPPVDIGPTNLTVVEHISLEAKRETLSGISFRPFVYRQIDIV